MAFARHRRAFREVVREGLLKAWRVNVSIPCAALAGVSYAYGGVGRQRHQLASGVKIGSALVGSRPWTLTRSRYASRSNYNQTCDKLNMRLTGVWHGMAWRTVW